MFRLLRLRLYPIGKRMPEEVSGKGTDMVSFYSTYKDHLLRKDHFAKEAWVDGLKKTVWQKTGSSSLGNGPCGVVSGTRGTAKLRPTSLAEAELTEKEGRRAGDPG